MTSTWRLAGIFALTSLALGFGLQGDASAQAKRKTPPLNLPGYELPRPPDVIRKTYQFAADHPDVLRYMPCFCGCNMSGHTSNADCFVKSRAKNGDVTAWQEHGAVCAMCLAVGETSARMYESGASLKDIRAEIERKYSGFSTTRTDTPAPPAK
jgi:hypothetical protein